jgi:hypothetical protein
MVDRRSIERLVHWSDPKEVRRVDGTICLERVGFADERFWTLWRQEEGRLRAVGIKCRQTKDDCVSNSLKNDLKMSTRSDTS